MKKLILIRYLMLSGLLVFTGSMMGCSDQKTEKTPPARVENTVPEDALATITLTPQAEDRLGIETATAEQRNLPQSRTLGGEVMVPAGRTITVVAPLSGMLLAPSGNRSPVAGTFVKKNQPVFKLLILPAQQDLLNARESLAVEEVRVEVARSRAQRTGRLLTDRAGSERENEQAQAELAVAEASVRLARARVDLLNHADPETIAQTLTPMVIESSEDGVIQKMFAAPGQMVNAGALLFEVTGQDPLWVRVPVYAGDLASLNTEGAARVRHLNERSEAAGLPVRPVSAPPSADPTAASVDLFFELPNSSRSFRPGQKVQVDLSLRYTEDRLAIPFSAIVYDMYGSAWVYENTAAHVFSRQRVEVDRVVGDMAVIARGLSPNATVVVTGVAELFGTEFGAGK